MPSVTYMNESAPFWDFVASLEQQGAQHPMFGGTNTNTWPNNDNNTRNEHERNDAAGQEHFGQQPFGPWGWGQSFAGMPYRGRPGAGEQSNQQGEAQREGDKDKEKDKEAEKKDECDNGEGPSGTSGSDNEGHRRRHGRCGGRRGRCGPGSSSGLGGPCGPNGFGGPGHNGFGGPWGRGGFGPRRGPPHGHHHGRGHWGPWGRSAPFHFECPDPSAFAAQFLNQFTDTQDNDSAQKATTNDNEDHTPDADIFDTESAFVIHVSLPGAKKEDIGVNWDAEKSELCIAGVIYRPGDEALLKTLAMGERKVGAFERKIRLGTRASPASIDAEGITAKLEDGVLRVVVGKVEEGFVEVRKVDIE